MKLITLVCVLIYLSRSNAKDYTNHKVYDVTPSKPQIARLLSWELSVDFWSMPVAGRASKIMVSPEVQSSFVDFLNQNQIHFELSIDNLQSVFDQEKETRLHSRRKRSALIDDPTAALLDDYTFELYWTYEEMEAFSIELAEQYPNLVTRDVIGQSIEGRDIFGMRVSSGTNFGDKPIIFIDSGVHAREWVGPAATLYLLNQLVTNATVTEELVDKVDWVFVNNANPDGYMHSFTEDRLWRKNRRVVNESCIGIDLNRNFGYVWQYTSNSCDTQIHSGASPISEPETQALTAYMESFKHNLRLYLSTHSYGPYVLWPFGFAFDTYVKNWKEHVELGQRWVDAIYAVKETFYVLGNSADLLYTANGASDDHALAYANANLAYTLELTGGGSVGFDFPEDELHDLVTETFLGYREFGLYIGEHYNYD